MLKVVGASWLKTRISTYILLGAALLAVGSFFIAEMDRPQFDGTFCATAHWSKKAGFHVEYWKQRNDLDGISKGVARICYKDSTLENGWSQLEIETQKGYPDWVQAFSAGLLEGTLTWSKIYYQWSNTISSVCDRDDDTQNFCTWLRDTLSNNYKSMKAIAGSRAKQDHYWHQIHLFYYQLEGLEAGWKKGAKRSRFGQDIPNVDFLLMNAAGDMQDLKVYFENFVMQQKENEQPSEKNVFMPSATMIAKIVGDGKYGFNLFFGHSSAGSYSSMLRMHKRYKLRYHLFAESKGNIVPGNDIIFTSYPGFLASTDDFYIVKGRHINSLIAGVAIKNNNLKLWKNVHMNNAVPLVARVMAANRLAQTRRTWARIMSRNPTTGNKQWVVFDLRKIDQFNVHSNTYTETKEEIASIRQKGFFWVVEQLPGSLHGEDMTDTFLSSSSAWFVNGVPYFQAILKASGVSDKDKLSQRAAKSNITDLDAVKSFLKSQAFRGDLLGSESIPYGNIDIKTFSYAGSTGHSDFHSIAGPLFMGHHKNEKTESTMKSGSLVLDTENLVDLEVIWDRRPVRDDIRALTKRRMNGPFKWSKTDGKIRDVKHHGHPDTWDFETFSPKWAWHD